MPEIVAGGIVAEDVPHVITERHQVNRDDSVGTKSGAYVPMPDTSLVVNPDITCGATIMFSGRAEQYGDLQERLTMGIALYLDGNMIAETILSPYAKLVYEWDPDWEMWVWIPYVSTQNALLITAVQDLPAGEHTFAMYYKGAQEFIGKTGLIVRERVLQVTLFYR